MARKLTSKTNVNIPTVTFPHGRVRDNPGDNTGTPVNEDLVGDYTQFFEQLMLLAGLVHNDLPENDPNGYQFNEALAVITRSYELSGTAGNFAVQPGPRPFFFIADEDGFFPGPTSGVVYGATYAGTPVVVKCINPAGITLNPDGANTFDGSASPIQLAEGEIVTLIWDGVSDYSTYIERKMRVKVIPFFWDMQADAIKDIAHGLTYNKILNVRAEIIDDVGVFTTPLVQVVGNSLRGGGTFYWDNTNISMRRFSNAESTAMFGFNSQFESASYSDVSVTRGRLIIEYTW